MDYTLNDLYAGRINPAQDEIIDYTPQYKQDAEEAEAFLNERLNEECKEKLQEVTSNLFANTCYTNFHAFAVGYRLGARLMLHMLSEEYPELD